ncbi:MAG: carbohydrate-binding domain-containing protein [Ruminococcaceae bacterium]|nr:carbohydrate-binding domain-containing protein [Oscillospiraceae bacterium]
MKRLFSALLALTLFAAVLSGCGEHSGDAGMEDPSKTPSGEEGIEATSVDKVWNGAAVIVLSDAQVTVDGTAAGTDPGEAVYTANDIVYYETGKDFTYGEGTENDTHTQAEADEHTVVHITQPGTYVLEGALSTGQIAVDLGKEATDDPDAVVTLILNGVDITCTVAPGVIFYNVYECGKADEETAIKDVDTSAAGANVIIADGSCNIVRGSYVARIYKPESVVLSTDGREVEDAKKLHKYDAAFYSKKTMNVNGETENSGRLYIYAENEGLDSELHLTINGGRIYIQSGNDGINTNEDYVSVTTVNGGLLDIVVTGTTGEGDGIDSNGWLVINGGTVRAAAYGNSMDSGIDSDMGIHINGGTVTATGNMLGRLEAGGQNYAVFQFAQRQTGGVEYILKNEAGETVCSWTPANDFSCLVFSGSNLAAGNYTLWCGESQMVGSTGGFGGMQMPGSFPSGTQKPGEGEWEDFDLSDLPWTPVDGQRPERGDAPPDGKLPERMQPPQWNQGNAGNLPIDPSQMSPPDDAQGGGRGPGMDGGFGTPTDNTELSEIFVIPVGGVTFGNVQLKPA